MKLNLDLSKIEDYYTREVLKQLMESLITIQGGSKGARGSKGDTGEKGDTGATGAGMPTGGTAGQIIVKNSSNDYDIVWADSDTLEPPSSFIPIYTAGHDISALKLVRFSNPITIVYATKNGSREDAQVIGMTMNAGTTGSDIKVMTLGKVDDAFFNYSLNTDLFLGNSGEIATSVGNPGEYRVSIGKGLGSGSVYIDIDEPIGM